MGFFTVLVIIDLVLIGLLFLGLVITLLFGIFKLLAIFGGLLFLFIIFGYVLSRIYKEKKKNEPEDIIDMKEDDET